MDSAGLCGELLPEGLSPRTGAGRGARGLQSGFLVLALNVRAPVVPGLGQRVLRLAWKCRPAGKAPQSTPGLRVGQGAEMLRATLVWVPAGQELGPPDIHR